VTDITFGITNGVNAKDNMVGDTVKLQSILIRMRVHSGYITPSIVRAILLWDNQPQAGNPVLGDILEITSSANYYVISPLNWINRRRFKVVRDKTFKVSPAISATTAGSAATTTIGINMKNWFIKKGIAGQKINYNTTTNAPENRALWFFVFTDTSYSSASPCEVDWICRMRYVDT